MEKGQGEAHLLLQLGHVTLPPEEAAEAPGEGGGLRGEPPPSVSEVSKSGVVVVHIKVGLPND